MLSVEDYAVYCTSMKSAWPRAQDLIAVTIQDYQHPVRILMNFVARSGHNKWQLVQTISSYLVNEPGMLQHEDGSVVALDKPPIAGPVCFVPKGLYIPVTCPVQSQTLTQTSTDAPTFSWRWGPQTGARGKVAIKDDHSSIASASGELSAQVRSALSITWTVLKLPFNAE